MRIDRLSNDAKIPVASAQVLAYEHVGPMRFFLLTQHRPLRFSLWDPDASGLFLWPGQPLQVGSCGDFLFSASASELVFLPPQMLQKGNVCAVTASDQAALCRLILYPADFLHRFMAQISPGFCLPTEIQVLPLSGPVRRTLRLMEDESLRRQVGSEALLLNLSSQLLVFCGRDLARKNGRSWQKPPPDDWPQKLSRVASYIRQNCAGSFRNEDLARLVKVHESSLCHRFKQQYGQSLQAYRRSCRLRMARQLLQRERLSVRQISRRCGYRSPSQFAAIFQKAFGQTPLQYRRERFLHKNPQWLDSRPD